MADSIQKVVQVYPMKLTGIVFRGSVIALQSAALSACHNMSLSTAAAVSVLALQISRGMRHRQNNCPDAGVRRQQLSSSHSFIVSYGVTNNLQMDGSRRDWFWALPDYLGGI